MPMDAKSSVMYDYLVTGKKGQKKAKPGKGGIKPSTDKTPQGPDTGFGKSKKSNDELDSNGPVVKKTSGNMPKVSPVGGGKGSGK